MDVGSLHFLHDLRRSGASPATLEQARIARWRLKNGLEHRALVALIHAPEAIPEARRAISPADFLTPAYAALAAIILWPIDAELQVERAQAAIAGRPYLPSPGDFDWASEARSCTLALAKRREAWAQSLNTVRRAGARATWPEVG